jgi:hypothetical protein
VGCEGIRARLSLGVAVVVVAAGSVTMGSIAFGHPTSRFDACVKPYRVPEPEACDNHTEVGAGVRVVVRAEISLTTSEASLASGCPGHGLSLGRRSAPSRCAQEEGCTGTGLPTRTTSTTTPPDVSGSRFPTMVEAISSEFS